ncbi:MAG: riboflavin synthase [bacterium]|nr:riboflavin synthase [bacterium]
MFSGLIQYTGELTSRSGNQIAIAAPAALLAQLKLGDSVAVNGVCLTAADLNDDGFYANLLEATLNDTTLGSLPSGSRMNLELALRAGDPLGGHIVQGHVDGTSELLSRVETEQGSWKFSFAMPDWLNDWIVPKGSICIDGVSLTVQELSKETFSVELIPTTLELTSLGLLQPGQRVNLEADLIVKTVSELLKKSRLTELP